MNSKSMIKKCWYLVVTLDTSPQEEVLSHGGFQISPNQKILTNLDILKKHERVMNQGTLVTTLVIGYTAAVGTSSDRNMNNFSLQGF